MFKNGEIELVIKLFEQKSVQTTLPYTGAATTDKAPRDQWKQQIFYNNGALNNQFLAFLCGYSAGKAVQLHED